MYVTIRVRCPWCDKSHEAPFHLAGKKVRCKKCTGVIKIPGEAVDSPLAAPSPSPPPPPARAAAARVATRVDSPPSPPRDLFDLDDDPSPPRRPPTLRQLEDNDYDDGPLPERVMVGHPPREASDDPPGKGKKRKRRRGSGEESTTWEKVQTGLLILGLVGCLLILGLGLFVPGGREIAVLLSFLAGMGMMMVGGIWSACIPFQESTRCGLMYLFVPFYAGYYTKTRFSEMFTPFLINIFGAFLFYMATLGPMNQHHAEPAPGITPAIDLDFEEDEEWLEDNGNFNVPDSGESSALPNSSDDAPVPPTFQQGSFGDRRGPDDQ